MFIVEIDEYVVYQLFFICFVTINMNVCKCYIQLQLNKYNSFMLYCVNYNVLSSCFYIHCPNSQLLNVSVLFCLS